MEEARSPYPDESRPQQADPLEPASQSQSEVALDDSPIISPSRTEA